MGRRVDQTRFEGNPYRNHAFDRGMSGYPHPKFPNVKQWKKYRKFNDRLGKGEFSGPQYSERQSEYEDYRLKRNKALHRGGEIYDRFHKNGRDLPGHDPYSLKKRFARRRRRKKKGKRYVVKKKEYPPPPEIPRKVPYHHGKYIGVPMKKTWFMAQQFCREQYGTNLASIMTKDELNELRHVCDEVAGYGHCWIGLRRPFGTWQDGKPALYTNFGPNGVNNLHDEPVNCIEILSINDNKQWNAQLCTVRRPFICEIPRKRTRGKFIAVGKTMSWESAENYCQQTYNTDLATIETKKENRLAMNLCRDISSDMHHCWIGLIKPFKIWTDGTKVKFENFKLGWTEDHKGLNVHENKKGIPEPYGEDDQDDANYNKKKRLLLELAQGKDHPNPPKGQDPLINEIKRDLKDQEEQEEYKQLTNNRKGMAEIERELSAMQKVQQAQDEERGTEQFNTDETFPKKKPPKKKKLTNDKNKKKKTKKKGDKQLKHNGYETENEKFEEDANIDKHPKKPINKEEEASGKDFCGQINTSYGGIWDKRRCDFRHFFICNNPSYILHKANKDREPDFWGRRRRLRYYDEYDDKEEEDEEEEEEEFLGKMFKKVFKKLKGRKKRRRGRTRRGRRRSRRRKNRRYRSRRRRRKRRRRRRKFMRWLRRHYGKGRRSKCGPRCPYKRIKIRSLPKDMHWSPLSGLLPMFGVQSIHRQKKKPKIHIVAKVHLPKHRTVDNGYLDYDLLNHLLFGEGDRQTIRNNRVMDDWNRKEKQIERMVRRRKDRKITRDYDREGNFNDKNRERRKRRQEDDKLNEMFDRNANGRRRRLIHDDDDDDDDEINIVSRCKILNIQNNNIGNYEICINYYLIDMSFSFYIKSLNYKEKRENKRRVFREIMDINQNHYKDYKITNEISIIDHPLNDNIKEIEDQENDEFVLFEPIDGNLGYAIWKYESLNWHKYKYDIGNFNNFDNYIRFNEVFSLTSSSYNECSETLNGIPFKLCIETDDNNNDKILYFEKDIENDIFDPEFSFRFKEFIDNEFEHSIFRFNDNSNWDEINVINMIFLEKCSYLNIAKVCMKEDDNYLSMTASISFQLMNKEIINTETQNFLSD